jgi:hypothetical protein
LSNFKRFSPIILVGIHGASESERLPHAGIEYNIAEGEVGFVACPICEDGNEVGEGKGFGKGGKKDTRRRGAGGRLDNAPRVSARTINITYGALRIEHARPYSVYRR